MVCKYFLSVCGLHFHLHMGFQRAKVFNFEEVHFISFYSNGHVFDAKSENSFFSPRSLRSPIYFFEVLFTFKLMIHLSKFLKDVKFRSRFI